MKYRSLSVCTILVFLCFMFASCASDPAPVASDVPVSETPEEQVSPQGAAPEVTVSDENDASSTISTSSTDDSSSVPLSVPESIVERKIKKSPRYSEILELVEKGSPASLNKAAALVPILRKDGQFEPDVQDLLYLAGRIMTLVYPLEPWTPFDPTGNHTDYLDAVDSAKNGIYDYNTGNKDVLAKILPSLVLVVSPRQAFYHDAALALDAGLRQNDKSVLALYLRGFLHELEGERDKASVVYQKAVKEDPSCYPASVALVQLGINSASSVVVPDAVRDYLSRAESLVTAYPQSAEMLELRARAAFAAKNWEKADSYITIALLRNPDNSDLLLMRAHMLLEKKDYLKANALLDAYAKVNPNGKTYLLLRAALQRDWNRNIKAAAATIGTAVEKYPSDSSVLLAAAELCLFGNVSILEQNSQNFIDKVLHADSDNIRAKVLSVLYSYKQYAWDTVIADGVPLLDSAERETVLLPVCESYVQTGNPKESLILLRPLAEKRSADPEFVDTFLASLIASGLTTEAFALIDSGRNSAQTLLRSVCFYYRSKMRRGGGDEEILSDLRSSLLANPRNYKSLLSMYEFYVSRKDYRKAMYYLKQAIALNIGDETLIRKQSELEKLIN